MRAVFLFAFVSSLTLIAPQAFAFQDMIRHNYVNCNACHVSATGGNALTPYGRSMSQELLSSWGTEREASFLNGVVKQEKLPDWLITGGDVRYLQTFRDTPTRQSARSMWMQTEIELGARAEKFGASIAVGKYEPRAEELRWVAPRFYAFYTPTDEMFVRAGRFVPVFGLNIPYHTLPTRQSLGFFPGRERDAVEAVWSGEKWNFAGSVSRNPAGPVANDRRESMVTLQANRNFAGHYRVGMSAMTAKADAADRSAVSAHAILGFSKQWAYSSEFTLQRLSPSAGSASSGLYHFSQLIYEPWKGFSFYLLEDYEKTNLSDSQTLSNSIGPGFRFFPRPHFEIDGVYLKKRVASAGDRFDTFAWLVAHYYF